MQTFLPFSDFKRSAEVLDKKRCWKQVVEAKGMLTVLSGIKPSRYTNHAALRQWKGYDNALKLYYNIFLDHCLKVHKIKTKLDFLIVDEPVILPPWIGYEPLHSSHRRRLLEKNIEFYSQFNWEEKPGGGYIWAVDQNYNLIPEIQEWLKKKPT